VKRNSQLRGSFSEPVRAIDNDGSFRNAVGGVGTVHLWLEDRLDDDRLIWGNAGRTLPAPCAEAVLLALTVHAATVAVGSARGGRKPATARTRRVYQQTDIPGSCMSDCGGW
jgi:hypothetical protein